MLTTYRRLFDLLDARERRRFWLLFGMVLVMGLLDALGVASILPFLAVLSNPEVVQENRWLASVYRGLGFVEPRSFLIFLGLVTFCLVVLGQVFKAVTAYTLLRFARMREFTIGSRLLSGYLHQPYEWFLGRHSAELGRTVLSEVNKAIEGVVIPALRLMAQSVVLIFLATLLLILNPLAAGAAAILVGGAYSAIYVAARHRLERLGRDRLDANEERFRMAQESLGAVKEVKAMGLEKRYAARFRDPAARFARRQAAIDALFETPRYLLEAIVFGGALVLLLMMLASEGGRLEAVLPVMGVFAFAGARMFPAMQIFYGSVSALRAYRPVLDLLHADLRSARAARPAAAEPLRLRRRLELVGVEYAYPGSARPALDGLTLAIEANTTVGVVGRTGSGKTTAIDVILGLLRPQRGQVLVDGVPLDDANLSAWQRNIGYVPQQIFLADDTIAANIAFGLAEDEIDMAAVERAARIAELHDFVVGELPLGYRARVGERGVRLSGGQRQRIGIARALYHDPDVLIFDEATSALDNETEKAVMDAVRNLAHAKTIIMIAHRLSSLSGCDQEITIRMGQCSPARGFEKFPPGGNDHRPRATAL